MDQHDCPIPARNLREDTLLVCTHALLLDKVNLEMSILFFEIDINICSYLRIVQ